MKCNSENATAEKRWGKIIEVLEDNIILFLQVLNEEYGFGYERQKRILEAVLRKAEEYNQAEDDGVLDRVTEHERSLFHDRVHELIKRRVVGIVSKEIYDYFYNTPWQTNAAAKREIKMTKRAKNAVSLKEAAALQQSMLAAKHYVEDRYNGRCSALNRSDDND